jgi:HAD superfamily hydrolase (TIGR01509 family)
VIKAVIFDMDGVLIEAKDWHYKALNKALHLFGLEITRHEHLTTFDGLPTRTKLEMLSLESGLSYQLHDFINEMKQLYTMEIVHTSCKPRFVHEYVLSNLKAQGYKLAVASNSIHNTIEIMMQKANLLDYFDIMFSAEDVSMPKPDPEIYSKAIDYFGLKPDECLIIEDNENGIKAAKASGANVLIVREVDEVNFDNVMNKIAKVSA